jgi:transposase
LVPSLRPGGVRQGRRGCPSDVTDEEWAPAAPYLAKRDNPLRDVFIALHNVVRTDCQWRYLPNQLPQWIVVYQRAQRRIRARWFETMVVDLRVLLREFAGRKAQPTAMVISLVPCGSCR